MLNIAAEIKKEDTESSARKIEMITLDFLFSEPQSLKILIVNKKIFNTIRKMPIPENTKA